MTSDPDPRLQVVEAVQLLFTSQVMSHSGHGNASMRVGGEAAERMVITGTPFIRQLGPEHMALTTFGGEVVEGELDPVVDEIVLMHADVYRADPRIGSVIHTHSPALTTFAMARERLPCRYESALRQGVYESIPVVEWAPRGSPESVRNIVDQIRAHPGLPCVLLANHGLLAFSDTPRHAAQVIVALEEAAVLMLGAATLGGARELPPGAFEREREHMRSFGSNAN